MKCDNRILIDLKNTFIKDSENRTGLLEMVEKHHSYLETCIEVLTDSQTSNYDKQNYLYQFLHILHMHAKAEEETLYAALLQVDRKDARLEGVVGQDEHNIIYQLASEIRDMDFSTAWSEEVEGKAKVLAIIVKTHLQEERQMFPLVKKYFNAKILEKLAADYLVKCEDYLRYEMLTPSQYSSQFYAPTLSR